MKKLIVSFIIIVLFSFCSARKTPLPSKEFSNLLNKESVSTNGKLLLNGYYFSCKNKNESLIAMPMFFFGNGLFYWSKTYHDSLKYSSAISDRSKLKFQQNNWGAYEIISDTLKVVLFEQHTKNYNELFFNYYESHYEGIVKEGGKIENWRLVKPYPKLKGRWNKAFLENAPLGEDLCFRHFPAKSTIDSSNVWINDYRKGK